MAAAAVRVSPANNIMAQPSNKRKRANDDIGRQLEEAQATAAGPDEDFSTSLLQHVEADNQRTTAEAALQAQHMPPYPDPAYVGDGSVASGIPAFPDAEPNQENEPVAQQTYDNNARAGARSKPAMGTDEWHAIRKASHKEGTSHLRLPASY
jgi:hypothetical protein